MPDLGRSTDLLQLLPALCWRVLGLEPKHTHGHTCRRLPSPSVLPVAARPHGPDPGLGSPLMKDSLRESSIHVSQKGWHMLLNLCFHVAMTSAVFAGGIMLTNYQMVCQAVSGCGPGSSELSSGGVGIDEGHADGEERLLGTGPSPLFPLPALEGDMSAAARSAGVVGTRPEEVGDRASESRGDRAMSGTGHSAAAAS